MIVALSPAGAQENRQLGKLVEKKKLVWGQVPKKDPAPVRMDVLAAVVETHKVDTGKQSGARFSIGTGQAGLLMGPESSFEFLGSRFDEKGFHLSLLDFRIHWGVLRYYSNRRKTERVLGMAPETVRIVTPEGREINLRGTDVYIHVDRKSGATTLYVAEGVAVVEGTEQGERALVEEGYWTYFRPGKPPIGPKPWPLKTAPDGGTVRFPDAWDPPAPLWLDLSRLDLPRVGPP